MQRVRSHPNIRVMFVESICDNEELLEANYRRYESRTLFDVCVRACVVL